MRNGHWESRVYEEMTSFVGVLVRIHSVLYLKCNGSTAQSLHYRNLILALLSPEWVFRSVGGSLPSSKGPRKQKGHVEHAQEVLTDLAWKEHNVLLTFLW